MGCVTPARLVALVECRHAKNLSPGQSRSPEDMHMTMKTTAATGAAIAFAAAAMFAGMSGTVVAAEEGKVHCYGVTSCKGQAACKGHGFKAMTQAECDAAGGTVGE